MPRESEVRWLQAHAHRLQVEMPGHWIILEGEDLVAHGVDFFAALEEARRKGVEIPFVERIPPPSSDVWMGP